MGPGLGEHLRLGLESLPRLATCCGPGRSDGKRALGTPAVLGAAAATSAAVGAGRERDVEPDGPCLGILEQQHLDSDLNVVVRRRMDQRPGHNLDGGTVLR
jgi:hypothetical protein